MFRKENIRDNFIIVDINTAGNTKGRCTCKECSPSRCTVGKRFFFLVARCFDMKHIKFHCSRTKTICLALYISVHES